MSRKFSWVDVFAACALTAGVVYALFWLKSCLPRGEGLALSVLLRPLLYGLGAGVLCALGAVLLLRKSWLSLALAGVLAGAWLLLTPFLTLTAEWSFSLDSALLGAWLGCVFVSVPGIAGLVARTHR